MGSVRVKAHHLSPLYTLVFHASGIHTRCLLCRRILLTTSGAGRFAQIETAELKRKSASKIHCTLGNTQSRNPHNT